VQRYDKIESFAMEKITAGFDVGKISALQHSIVFVDIEKI